jgi:16S rRNA C967 or C1407 C5-methylase (RsmB/RsmF family)/NOL1/NOP2/fmu family ribosome biogenesis protein
VQLPDQLLESLKDVKGFDKEAFEKVHASGEQVTSVRINPKKIFNNQYSIFNVQEKVPWCEHGIYLNERPSFTFDPLFHAGCYYVQEASSMFLEQALKQTVDLSQSLRVLDLSAAPGGKSTHIQSLISRESLLVSNEVIRSRANILKDNIIKWGCNNVVVTNNDPKDFARLKNYFDVIVVDAPCSGSGLFRRDPMAIEEWSLNNVALCSQRQQRILADIWPALKKEGLLIYATCSYSKEEDEEIVDWMMKQLRVKSQELRVNKVWNIVEVKTDNGGYGYRFFPDKLKGEGFFIACFRKTDGEEESYFKIKNKPEQLIKKEKDVVEKWINTEGLEFIKHQDTVYAWPSLLVADFNLLLNNLRVIYSGTIVGELMRDKLVPNHALAMSGLVNETISTTELSYEQAIEYLQKRNLKLQHINTGWQLVTFQGHALGWINALPNRINNYYPKELRILKEPPSPPAGGEYQF